MAHNFKVGLKNVGSYQSSGTPYVTGGLNAAETDGVFITFPYVTRWISVYNDTQDPCKLAFTQNGLMGSNFYQVGDGQSITLEVKATALYLSGTEGKVDVMAGLTSIEASTLNSPAFSPSGSNWSGSVWAQVG
jgi:hypothetical protein